MTRGFRLIWKMFLLELALSLAINLAYDEGVMARDRLEYHRRARQLLRWHGRLSRLRAA